jgi:cytochrome P450
VINNFIFTLYEISQNERVDTKLFEELKAALPSKDSPVDEKVLNNLPYLNACVSETLRVNSAVPNVARISDRPLEIRGYKIPAYVSHFWNCMLIKRLYMYVLF